MDAKKLRTPVKSRSVSKEFCTLCQCPFNVLTIDTPAIHMHKCKFRQSRTKGECPDGMNCKESMPSHYWLYSHNVIKKYRNDPENAPPTPKQSKSIDQIFQSLHGRSQKSSIKSEQKKTAVASLKTAYVDLTDSQTSSEEFTVKSIQSYGKSGSKLSQRKLSFNGNQKSTFKQISVKAQPCTTPQKHKLNLCKNCTEHNSKKPKMSKKLVNVKIEKPITENPWSIAASQASKSLSKSKIWSQQNGSVVQHRDMIDLTEDDDPSAADVTNDVSFHKNLQKDPNENIETQKSKSKVETKKNEDKMPENSPKISTANAAESKITSEVRVNLKINNSFAEWLKSPQRRKPMFSQTADKLEPPAVSSGDSHTTISSSMYDDEVKHSEPSIEHNKSVKSDKSQATTQETVDSEDWGINIPRGPGFVPLSPIQPIKDQVSTLGVLVTSDEEYFSATSEVGSNVSRSEGKTAKMPTSAIKSTIAEPGKNIQTRTGSTMHVPTALLSTDPVQNHDEKSEPQDGDEDISDNDDATLDYSLLLGQTQKFSSFMGVKATKNPGAAPGTQSMPEVDANANLTSRTKKLPTEEAKASKSSNTTINHAGSKQETSPADDVINAAGASKSPTTTANTNADRKVLTTNSSTPILASSQQPSTESKQSDGNTKTNINFLKGKTKQKDIGSMLFGMKPKIKPEVKLTTQNENVKPKQEFNSKGNYAGPRNKRHCPFYKRVEGTDIAVDAFSYNIIEGVQFYLLSHFHYDHYMGLTKKYWKHKVYCSEITGNLVAQKIGLPEELIVCLPMKEEVLIGNVRVTLLEANHCPGAVLFLFKLRNNRTILHTGDFRAGEEMEQYSALQNIQVDLLYLDTTYLDAAYQFPLQCDVIKTAVSIAIANMQQNPKTLFVIGTYLIGKEKIFAAIAKAIGTTAFVTQDKFRTVQCLMDKELSGLVTKKPDGARVHVVAMKSLNITDLKSRLVKHKEFEEIVAIKPTGWTHDRKHPDLSNIKPVVTGPVKIYGLPYSEHSSFEDLRRFVKFLRPKKVLPTVNVGKKESRDKMSKYLDKWRLGLDV